MPRLPRISGAEAVAAFQKAGWILDRVSGSHHILKRAGNPNRLSIPVHKGKYIGKGLLKAQIDAAGLTVAEFIALL